MLYNVYVVRDKLAEEAGPPFTAVNDKVALRQFQSMGIPESLKDEYELLKIGYYDSIDVSITPLVSYTLTGESSDTTLEVLNDEQTI